MAIRRLTGFDDANLSNLNQTLQDMEDHRRQLIELKKQVERLVKKTFGQNTN